MKTNIYLFITTLVMVNSLSAIAQKYQVLSPDQEIRIEINVSEKIGILVQFQEQLVVHIPEIALHLSDKNLPGENIKINNTNKVEVNKTIIPVVAEKRSKVINHCNELTLEFKNDYSLIFRAYNDGVAYRWVLKKKDEVIIKNEIVSFNFEEPDSVYFPEEESFLTHSERLYPLLAIKDISEKQMACMPVLVKKPDGVRVAITEADLWDYPGMYLKGSSFGEPRLSGLYPPYPAEEEKISDRTMKVSKTEDFIAKTSGNRKLPWRVMIITDDDGKLVESDMIFRLGSPNRIENTDWIKPGKVAWDWWNALNIYGVGFESGLNTATYKYYIDFAAEYEIPYIILDEGWSDTEDLFSINPDIDLPELFSYAESKNVGIILWVVWSTLDEQLDEAMDKFHEWGVKGIKVDFMQRDDQKMVNYYWKIAREAADHNLLVDFHGSYKPTGLRRTYPNVLTREGVRGLEHSKWSEDITPEHDLILPFTRMLAGPMDFTPGAMINCTPDQFKPVFNRPMSQGTRCHQLAMYVVYESPLQMLADSPSNYYKEFESMEFLKQVPVTWDETIVPQAKVGEYILMIRQKDEKWYIGAMTNWELRTLEVDLSFLTPGNHKITLWQDGPNADKNPQDLKIDEMTIDQDGKLFIKLTPGGGFVGVIE